VGGTILHVSDTFVRKETGTFMHELGHNLNLVHGGDLGGRRPNYMSVMNYSYAYSGISRIVGRSPGVYDAPGTFATRFDGVDPGGTAGSGEVAGNDPTVSIGGSEFAGGGDGRIAVAPFGESLRLTIHDNSDPPHFTDYSVTEGGERCPWCKPGATGGSGLSWIRPGALNSEHPKLGGDRDPSHRYLYIGHGPILSALDLNQAGSGDSETTYTCVPPGSHLRIVVDRDTRGIVDDSQCKWCERP
jgi:hypothetical protein